MNVGPTGRGVFDARACECLDAFADWMVDNARSIYGCTAAPRSFKAPAGTELTYNPKTNRLYIHVVDWPTMPILLSFRDKVEYAQLLADASEVGVNKDGSLKLPTIAPKLILPVVEVFLKD